jgi:hypothetical protein
MLELKIFLFFRFWGRFGPKCTFFSTFDLENYCQGHIFPTSQYQKRVVGEKLKSFELSRHTVLAVGRLKKKQKQTKTKKHVPTSSFNVISYFVATIFR